MWISSDRYLISANRMQENQLDALMEHLNPQEKCTPHGVHF
jgi:hypothetical protein